MKRAVYIALIACINCWMYLAGCRSDGPIPDDGDIPLIVYTVIGSHPHDTNSFTEGLLYFSDSLFESTGCPPFLPATRSVFGPIDLATGRIRVRVELDKEKYFGEGVTFLDGKYYQLTYRNKIGFIYDAVTYQQVGQFFYLSDEGWGLTTDGESLIMSDGTERLTYIDPQTFIITKILTVTEEGAARSLLNELEFIRGHIYANVWLSNTIVKIDPSSGKVTGRIDMTDLMKEAESIYPGSKEMNGIAWDPVSGNIFITGKCWPKIYKITLAE
jgi:glutaminyl-peptide cyclotransferase